MPRAVTAFCRESGGDSTTEWYPQGITTSADASPDGEYEDKTVVLTSWYYYGSGANKDARVSFVNYAKPSAPRYRHVLLVEPYYEDAAGNPNFRAVPVHAGGTFWYCYYLYVADTWGGFRCFNLSLACVAVEGCNVGCAINYSCTSTTVSILNVSCSLYAAPVIFCCRAGSLSSSSTFF